MNEPTTTRGHGDHVMPRHDLTPFLANAIAWIRPDDEADVCTVCGFSWTIDLQSALVLLEHMVDRHVAVVEQRDGMAAPADSGWNATAYLWHLTDLARSWAERWVQLSASPGSRLIGWDPDDLAAVRGYRSLPTSAATWALRDATTTLIELTRRLDPLLEFEHGDWGNGHVTDGIRWVTHEYVHHLDDVIARSVEPTRRDGVAGTDGAS